MDVGWVRYAADYDYNDDDDDGRLTRNWISCNNKQDFTMDH